MVPLVDAYRNDIIFLYLGNLKTNMTSLMTLVTAAMKKKSVPDTQEQDN